MNANDKDPGLISPLSGRDNIQQRFNDDFSRLDVTIAQSRSKIHGFLQRFLRRKGLDDDIALHQFQSIVARARSIVDGSADSSDNNDSCNVPKIIHRIWLTDGANPVEPPQNHVNRMISESREYSDNGWQLWLWIADPAIIAKTVRTLNASGAPIVLKSYQVDILSGEPWEENFKKLLADRKFAFAADLLRMKLLYQYGGFYADLGARVRERGLAEFVIENFEYAFIFWETMFFQNSLMMMSASSSVGKVYMELANEPYGLPESLFYPLDGLEEGMAFSGLLITALVIFSAPETRRICPLAPNGEVVEWSSERSWYTRSGEGLGKFGNAYIPETCATFLRREGFKNRQPLPIFLP